MSSFTDRNATFKFSLQGCAEGRTTYCVRGCGQRCMCMWHDEQSLHVNCRVEMRVQMADAYGAVLSGTDLNEAISPYTAVSWHLSYPWATTQSTRRFGGSMVILYDGDGYSFVGLFKAAVDIARKWGVDTSA